LSAGQILKPLNHQGKIHSEQQSTKYNMNPYSDAPQNSIPAFDQSEGANQEGSQNSGLNEQPGRHPSNDKRNRSYTRGRKNGARNQYISHTLNQGNSQSPKANDGPSRNQNHQNH